MSGKSIRGILHYNEDKVTLNEATLILASGFAADIEKMDFGQKLQRFRNLTELSARVKTNAMHITLNFDASDKLDNSKLQNIASEYMERIGFGDQPFLVYRHLDAHHPHIHIATTNMKRDGTPINIHGIGYRLSESTRKDLETKYSLVRAEGRQLKESLTIKPAIYGQKPTKQTISNIVNTVIRTYKFSSLAEMNAVLKQFNVIADRGEESTKMFQKGGLMYSIINQDGEQVGIPIKASSIYQKPTLANLEKKFKQGAEKRHPFKTPLRTAIEKVFEKYETISKTTFIAELEKQNINTILRTNAQGNIYGITFIDNKNKTVFNGSDLGKFYSARAIFNRFGTTDRLSTNRQETYLPQTTTTNYLKKEEQEKYELLIKKD